MGGRRESRSVTVEIPVDRSRDGRHYHVVIDGDDGDAEESVSVVLLHGFTGSHRDWEGIVPPIVPDYRVIRPDLPGHGRSTPPPREFSMEKAAAELLSVLDTVQIGRTCLVGYSMGGRLALHMILAAPAKFSGFVLESSSYGIPDLRQRKKREQDDRRLARNLRRDGVAAFVKRWESLPLFASQRRLPSDVRRRQRTDRLKRDTEGLARVLETMGTGGQACLDCRLDEITVPTLIVAGQLDAKYAAMAAEMNKMIPRSRVEVVRGAGHNVHLERPIAFATTIRSFIESL